MGVIKGLGFPLGLGWGAHGHHFPAINAPAAGGEEEVAASQAAEPSSALPASVSTAPENRHTRARKGDRAVKQSQDYYSRRRLDVTLGPPVEDSQRHVVLAGREEAEHPSFEPRTEVKFRARNLHSTPSDLPSARSGGGTIFLRAASP